MLCSVYCHSRLMMFDAASRTISKAADLMFISKLDLIAIAGVEFLF